MEYSLFVNTDYCMGCTTCEVACKQEHELPVGPRWIRVHADVPRKIAGKPVLRYLVSHCVHCSHPPCKNVCPVNAITKREDGVVLIDEELCTGCGDCVEACPLKVIQINNEKAQKCDLCVDRLDRGLQPACVAACPSNCIYFGDISEVISKTGKNNLLLRYKGNTA
ncbi:MAG: 4Fe-4S dicluster domain-containing protein [Chloroflexota bacterium]